MPRQCALLLLALCVHAPAAGAARRRIREFYTPAVFSSPLGEIDYATAGTEEGTPVLYLHGIPDSYHAWDPLIPKVPESFYSIAVSLRGWGDSVTTPAAPAVSIEDYAEEVLALLDHLRVRTVTVVAYSLGQHVALQLARTAPERIHQFVFLGVVQNADHAGLSLDELGMEGFHKGAAELYERAGCGVKEGFCDFLSSETRKVPQHVVEQTLAAITSSALQLSPEPAWPTHLVVEPALARSVSKLGKNMTQTIIASLHRGAYAHWTHSDTVADLIYAIHDEKLVEDRFKSSRSIEID